jgi:cytochrome b6-f complex iron-sulfur subunit
MKRRRFLKIILAFLASITLLSFVYSLFKFLAALPARTAETKKLIISKNEIPSGNAKDIIFRNTPAVIINRPDKGFIALSRVCTHLGCLVEYDRGKQRLICPCHAGNFDLEGNVLSGPPPKPLPAIPLRIEGENIVIG